MTGIDPLRSLACAAIVEPMESDWSKGCGITALFFALLGVAFCVKFTDASAYQSTEDCIAKMSAPILEKTAALPSNAVLRAKNATIEHDLYGNESQVRRLSDAFEKQGWHTTVEPQDEIGWAVKLIEDPTTFRLQAAQRVRQLCAVAAKNDVRYRRWWINAPDIADYVSQ